MKSILILFAVLIVNVTITFGQLKHGHIKLMGWSIGKCSHMYFKLLETGKEFDITFNSTYCPTIPLYSTIPCNYFMSNGWVSLEFNKYQYARYTNDKRGTGGLPRYKSPYRW